MCALPPLFAASVRFVLYFNIYNLIAIRVFFPYVIRYIWTYFWVIQSSLIADICVNWTIMKMMIVVHIFE